MKQLQRTPDLQVTILIDYLRGTRGLKHKQVFLRAHTYARSPTRTRTHSMQ